MEPRRALILGCGGLAVAVTAFVALLGLWFLHVTKDPEALWLSAEVPSAVKVGDSVNLVVKVANRSLDEHIVLGDLDIADDYLRGFSIQSVDPDPKSTEIDTINDCTTTRFAATLSPGAEAEFKFELRAERVGRYRGQVDQYVGLQFLSTVVETEVGR